MKDSICTYLLYVCMTTSNFSIGPHCIATVTDRPLQFMNLELLAILSTTQQSIQRYHKNTKLIVALHDGETEICKSGIGFMG